MKCEELNEFIKNCYYENSDMFETCKNIIDIISFVAREPGINRADIWSILFDAKLLIQELKLEKIS